VIGIDATDATRCSAKTGLGVEDARSADRAGSAAKGDRPRRCRR
jgi:hypothetical protein